MSDNYVYLKVKLNIKDFQTEESVREIVQDMQLYFGHEDIVDHEIVEIYDIQADNRKSKVVMFSRPVAIEDVTYEVRVPEGLTKEEEVDWIMNNRDRVKCISNYPERYSLSDSGDPNLWTEWEVTIDPALNNAEEYSEEHSEELDSDDGYSENDVGWD